jgi:LruC domain-containing protein
MKAAQSGPVPISGNYYYMGGFTCGNYKGLPDYLESNGDHISQSFLNEVNASLPESKPVPTNNPSYLASSNELDVVVEEKSDVWVTFVTEGAGYRNTLGYYVFDSDNPPSSPAQIDSIFVIFPNASLSSGGGGQLNPGDKVKLGTFPAGKTISWVLFQKGWTGSRVRAANATKFYSKPSFNNAVESDNSKNQHTVQLADIGRELLLNGFEDQTRSNKSDNDFNDLIFYVTANPWEAIDIGNVPPTTPSEDDDNDGVGNEGDDFPNDPTRAVSNDFSGTLAYEDLWPNQGDYDFNDLVLDYQIEHVLNSGNKLVEINADWTVKAIGAAYENGFGIQFQDIAPGVVSGVTGQDLSKGIVSNNANGTESGQQKATVIFFENARDVMPPSSGFINTRPGTAPVNPQTVSNGISFNTPQDQAKVGYNPFIYANGTRGREVHLAGKDATTLANSSLFGTGDDASNTNNGSTYQNAQNLPWAIHVKGNFKHPIEQTAITSAYNFFAQWATSGGTQYPDWYTDQSGYRNAAELY